ncbi:MAG TPA: GHKL domain-containing protein [Bacillus bacterium]|nr:GHKL domain-containing protein [Bacillus sp. (in: firmicutes)]
MTFQLVTEGVIFLIISLLFPKIPDDLLVVEIAVGSYIVVLISAWIIYRKNIIIYYFDSKANYLSNYYIKPILTAILFQVFFVMLIVIGWLNHPSSYLPLTAALIVLSTSALILSFLIKYGEKIYTNDVLLAENVHIKNLEDLLTSIRIQRHDFNNHLQVISQLTFNQSYNELEKYLIELETHNYSNNLALSIPNPAVAALLKAKEDIAQRKGIKLIIDIASTTSFAMEMKMYELIEIMGNLINNAIEAEEQNIADEKKIFITINTLYESIFVFSVHNKSSVIKMENQDKIFIKGYTSKDNHQGLGFHSVMTTLRKYAGHLELNSNSTHGTEVIVFIPLHKKRGLFK